MTTPADATATAEPATMTKNAKQGAVSTRAASPKSKSKAKTKKKPASKGKPKSKKTPIAATQDRHVLYQAAVQAPEAEIDFVDDTFKELRGRRAELIREDFCGTAFSSCEWVKRRPANRAIGVDLDHETLEWGREHNIGSLSKKAQSRIELRQENVLTVETPKCDAVLAMNFSYFIFQQRDLMRRYFKKVLDDLAPGGLMFLDCYGGYESFKECRDAREVESMPGVKYIWDQNEYDPITGRMQCYIHFHFKDGSKMNKAFSYEWRMWTLPEIREILDEAGFARTTVYWEGTDEETGEGDGDFQPREHGDADPAWIAYIVAEK